MIANARFLPHHLLTSRYAEELIDDVDESVAVSWEESVTEKSQGTGYAAVFFGRGDESGEGVAGDHAVGLEILGAFPVDPVVVVEAQVRMRGQSRGNQ